MVDRGLGKISILVSTGEEAFELAVNFGGGLSSLEHCVRNWYVRELALIYYTLGMNKVVRRG